MQRGFQVVAISALVAGATLAIRADVTPPTQAAEIQLQLGNLFFSEGRFPESLDAYQHALRTDDASRLREARSGVIQSALRLAEYDTARVQAEALLKSSPHNAEAVSLYGDSLWASGLFEQAEAKYKDALSMVPELARGRHGLARSLLARSQVDAAMNEAQAALLLAPRDLEIHHTVGAIYERMHKFEEAAVAYGNYVNLLPNKDTSDKAAWSRAEIGFLRSFGQRIPFEMDPAAETMLYTVPFKLVNDKIVVRAKINNRGEQDFIVDTGSESTVITDTTAQRIGVAPVTYTLSAGVGEVGLRGLQLARLDSLTLGSLKLRNVPCIIKNPPLRNLPIRERESLSPLALGFSMMIDYKEHTLTLGKHLPQEPRDVELPLTLYRLATVRGTIGADHQVSFVVDTGGEVISISQATATSLHRPAQERRIALKVYGTSGWDRDAFLLLPGVDLAFDAIRYKSLPVVVLNLTAPSALLGFQLGGTIGHKFLSRYRVGIDLERSVLRLKATG